LRRLLLLSVLVAVFAASPAEAKLVRLRVERREVVLDGRAFGLAGPSDPTTEADARSRRSFWDAIGTAVGWPLSFAARADQPSDPAVSS
jgi:hypothetical protein